MKVKNLFKTRMQSNLVSMALLIVRLIVGTAFVLHGSGKMQHPFAWMPPEAGIPGFFQFLASISEFGGGLFLIIGFLTPLALFGLFCTMSVAVFFHVFIRHDPFVNLQGGMSFEPALVYWGITLLLFSIGPGKFSLDTLIFKNKEK